MQPSIRSTSDLHHTLLLQGIVESCWLDVHWKPTSFSARQLPTHRGVNVYWVLWLFCSRCRTRHLSLLKFMLLINSTAFSTSGWIWAGLKQVFQVSESTANDKAKSHQCNLWDEECRAVYSSFRLCWCIQSDQVWKHTFNLPLLFNNF